jgi:N-acetylglucosaminyldiphosphoundecaprenol N-acetyl-beta-D-mannosaminyltransferase
MKLLNIEYNNLTVDEALASIFQLIGSKDKSNVFFLNADCLYKTQRDTEYAAILSKADLVLPDGIGIKLATKLFGGTMREDCNGTDLSPKILKEASKRKLKVFFLGGKEGIAQKAAENIQQELPEIEIAGFHSGYFNDDQAVINVLNAAKPDILFVAMGVPVQEKWIASHRAQLNARLCLGVGAFFDYLSGSIPRAPALMRKLHLEWFWRIFIDPRRMFKRYIIDGVGFMVYLTYRKIRGIHL